MSPAVVFAIWAGGYVLSVVVCMFLIGREVRDEEAAGGHLRTVCIVMLFWPITAPGLGALFVGSHFPKEPRP